jgi:hypothetical protein
LIGHCAFAGALARRSVVDWHNLVVSSDYRTIMGLGAQVGGRAITPHQTRFRTSVQDSMSAHAVPDY